ncbi:hypothetical protein AGMMS49982_02720 [Bacteroidia bacterium]|nr:hypothetical protein AGMMS49982_02720 [Bacteroidia bacterium]
MNKLYKQQVELLLKIIPTLSGIDDFAVHGGTAINLYVLDLPRYSVDIDVTYIPIKSREKYRQHSTGNTHGIYLI